MKRKPLTKRGSKRLFRKTAGTNYKNVAPEPMRGGIRN